MLNPASSRCDYGQLLRPPSIDETGGEAYELDAAIATTYSLDLDALLVLPVSLVLGDTLEGNLAGEKIALLEAIGQLNGRLKVFYQRGNIHLPPNFNRLFGLLEPMLAPIVPAGKSAAFSSFHPKLWLLRYTRADRRATKTADPKARYRLLVMSRNLTFDRNWDVSVCLDGVMSQAGARSNDALAQFIESLAPHAGDFKPLLSMVRDLPRVQWSMPQPFRDPRMLPGGGAHIAVPSERFGSPLDFGYTVDELLVVSPFLDASEKNALDWLSRDTTAQRHLISRSDVLDALGPARLAGWRCYALNDQIVDGEELLQQDQARTQNLHAKLIVSHSGQTAHWHLGSANATIAALGSVPGDTPRNTEFMLRLSGSKEKIGVSALLEQWTGEAGGRFIVEHEFAPLDDSEMEPDRQRLRLLVHQLIASKWKLDATPRTDGRYDVRLSTTFRLPPPATDEADPLEVRVGQLSQPGLWRALQDEVEWQDFALTQLSALVPVQIRDRENNVRESLVIQATLTLPRGVNRSDAVLRELVDTPDKFLDYVRLLLNPGTGKETLTAPARERNEMSDLFGFDANDALFEQLMLAAARNHDQLRRVGQLVSRLGKLNIVVPRQFSELWTHFSRVAGK
jgi:hypothetical protein